MSIKMKLKHLITISLTVLLSACNQPPTTQSNEYKEPVSIQTPVHTPIQQENDGIDASDVALGVATGAVVGAVAKSSYDKRKAKQRQVVVVNKHYYQSGGGNNTRTKYKSTYRKRK